LLDGADLSGSILRFAYLSNASLSAANLKRANMTSADLTQSTLVNASLRRANLEGAFLNDADLTGACLDDANVQRANLAGVKLWHSSLYRADLSGASLQGASIVDVNLEAAKLNGCYIYGLSVWNVNLDRCEQVQLIVDERHGARITVDNLEIAQFVHLLIRSSSIRNLIDELAAKVVLILGRFTRDRKPVLEAVADVVRRANLLPIIVDFEKPRRRDINETVSALAHLAKFVIADITDARSVPQELSSIVPALPSVPVLPLLNDGEAEYGMFEHFKRFPSVLPVHRYKGVAHLRRELPGLIVEVNLRLEVGPN
jgi:hypothetical protein